MMKLVYGGSGSGKSAYAEDCIMKFQTDSRYYLATMKVFGEEERQKIARHQKLREGKGFSVLEYPENVGMAAAKIEGRNASVLLECMSNLAANEMFQPEKQRSADETAQKILADVLTLEKASAFLVVVSNSVFEDGNVYEKSTMQYIEALGKINCLFAEHADEVVEIVAGIPVKIK
ncbi:MAG: bifunctional adenosylcobinamide kinase/adenosylcobinamide-phosphate guanylyltransferase [Spirochaetaceae bacterium]|nr:bifunctional adenosylcobinamide kinase/adenosylcobinamide-phosphate guanylyltransferase [Spirochaetaceae bacterium]